MGVGGGTHKEFVWADGETDNGTIYRNGDNGAGFEVNLYPYQVGDVS